MGGVDGADERGELEAAELAQGSAAPPGRPARAPPRPEPPAPRAAALRALPRSAPLLATRASAAATVRALRSTPCASRPVPRPTTSSGSAPVSAHSSAAAVAVLPIPISPRTRQSAPLSLEQRAGQLGPGGERGVALPRRHGGTGDEVGRPRGAAAIDAARRGRAAQADVGDDEGLFARAREDADGRLAAGGRARRPGPRRRRRTGSSRAQRGRGRRRRPGAAARRGAGGGAPVAALQRSTTSSSAPRLPAGLTRRSARSRAAMRAAASGTGVPVGGASPRRPALVRGRHRRADAACAQPARSRPGRDRALVGPADAQPRHGLDRVGDAEHGAQLGGPVEADPADAEALGARGEPQVLDRAGGRVDVGRGDGRAAQDLGPRGRRHAAHAHPDGRLEDALDLLVEEGPCPRSEARRLARALALGQGAHARAGLGGAHDDEAPRLRQPDRRSAVARLRARVRAARRRPGRGGSGGRRGARR